LLKQRFDFKSLHFSPAGHGSRWKDAPLAFNYVRADRCRGRSPRLAALSHQQPLALFFAEIERPHRSDFGSRSIWRLDVPKKLTRLPDEHRAPGLKAGGRSLPFGLYRRTQFGHLPG
jgi:hypothetical protein